MKIKSAQAESLCHWPHPKSPNSERSHKNIAESQYISIDGNLRIGPPPFCVCGTSHLLRLLAYFKSQGPECRDRRVHERDCCQRIPGKIKFLANHVAIGSQHLRYE